MLRTSTGEVQRLAWVVEGEMKSAEIQQALELNHRETFRDNYLTPSIEAGFFKMTEPESPNSPETMSLINIKGACIKKKFRR